MKTYLDTSALIKLVVAEPESPALRSYLGTIPYDTRMADAAGLLEIPVIDRDLHHSANR